MKKQQFVIASVALVLSLLTLAGCGGSKTDNKNNTSEYVKAYGNFHTTVQDKYLRGNYEKIDRYADGKKELSLPEAIVLDWSDKGVSGPTVLEISTNAQFNDSTIIEVSSTSYDLYNACIATTYYWRAAASRDALGSAEIVTFETMQDAPRNLMIDGVTNVRDLGGWMTDSGKRINQGLLFRGGRLNTSDSETVIVEITEKGKTTLATELGIKTELDLRRVSDNEVGGITESVVPGVNYVNIEMENGWIGGPDAAPEQLVRIFELLANRDNYPIYFHCNIGTDRTGTIAYLVNALLGVSEEDLYREYLFSNFGEIGSSRPLTSLETTVLKTIDKIEGATTKEKVEKYLLEIGVTQQQIDSIRSIMLG